MKKNFSNRGFRTSLILGVFLILLVMVVGVSFFWAIYSTQVDRRKDFLGQQTDLAGRGLENELDRFEEEATIFLGELEEHTAKNRQDELGKLARKMLTSFPRLVDTLWVADPQGLVTSYVYTERNDFIQKEVPQFPLDSVKPQLLLEGKMGHRIIFSTTLARFAQDYLEPRGEGIVSCYLAARGCPSQWGIGPIPFIIWGFGPSHGTSDCIAA